MLLLKQILKSYWDYLLLAFLGFGALLFLFLQNGVWLYLDVGWWPKNEEELNLFFNMIFSTWPNFTGTALGYDAYHVEIQRSFLDIIIYLINLFVPTSLSQAVYYSIFFALGYFFSRKLFFLLSEDNYKLAALFYTINPFSIYLISQGHIFAVYFTLPIFFFSLYSLVSSFKYKHLLINILSLLIIFYYARILGLLLLLLFFILIFYYRDIIVLLRKMKASHILISAASYLLVFGNHAFAIALPFFDQTASQFNYVQESTLKGFYYHYNTTSVTELLSIGEATNNFGEAPLVYFLHFIISASLLTTLLLMNSDRRKKRLFTFSIFLALFSYVILLSGKFLSIDIFGNVYSYILPILYKNLKWTYLFLVIAITLLILSRKKIAYKYYSIFIISFCLAILPTLNWNTNLLLAKIDDFDATFNLKRGNVPAVFFPYDSSVMRAGYPYPLRYYLNPTFTPLFTRNIRFVGGDHVYFYNQALEADNKLSNYFILGLQDFVVFNDSEEWDFLVKNQKKLKEKAKRYFESNSEKYVLSEQNETYSLYNYRNSERFDYFIYSPKETMFSTVENFSNLDLTPESRALVLNEYADSVHPRIRSSFVEALQFDTKLDYKYSHENSSKYYVKASRSDELSPIIVHLNQTFHPDWSLYFISESQWNSVVCKTSPHFHDLTNNSKCDYEDSVYNMGDLAFFNHTALNKKNHFRGNLLGNSFLITATDIPEEFAGDDSVYMVLYFNKQNYYVISLMIILFTLCVLLLLVIREKYEKNN